MRIVTPPEHLHLRSDEISIFLAGGITDCPNWQQDFINLVERNLKARYSIPSLVFLNPRRINFSSDSALEQIEWEYDMLTRHAQFVVFWFCADTVCPIALYELGYQMARKKFTGGAGPEIFIGCDTQYSRKFDVEVQANLVQPYTIRTDLWRLASDAAEACYQRFLKRQT